MSSATTASQTPITDSIRRKVEAAFDPVKLTITNNSDKHSGHSAMRGVTSRETHFELEIITPNFQGKSQVARHRLVNGLLDEEIGPGLIHALQLHTRTPEEDEKFQARELAKKQAASGAH